MSSYPFLGLETTEAQEAVIKNYFCYTSNGEEKCVRTGCKRCNSRGGGPEAQQFGLENAPEVINKWAGELLTTSGHGGEVVGNNTTCDPGRWAKKAIHFLAAL